jgi:hypothetical protein
MPETTPAGAAGRAAPDAVTPGDPTQGYGQATQQDDGQAATQAAAKASEAADQAREKASEAADQAREKASDVADQAREKAGAAADQARGRMREQVDERSKQLGEQASTTASDLRAVGEQLREQGKDTPAKLADQVAERTERVGSYLTESNADTILSDAEDLARKQPLAVLAGGLVLGFAAARFLKASSSERYRSRQAATGSNGHSPNGLGRPGASIEARSVPQDAPAGLGAAS